MDNVTVRGAVAVYVERHLGADMVRNAMSRLLRAVDAADERSSADIVLAGDMFSRFVRVPIPGKEPVCLRVYWQTDAATGRKTVVCVRPG